MSAAVHPRTEVRLMQAADLKAVAAVERAAYKFPWSLGIFRDCLLAGYHCLALDVGGASRATASCRWRPARRIS